MNESVNPPSSLRLQAEFFLACLVSSLKARWSMPGGHRPLTGRQQIRQPVPPSFFGVGVATNDNSEVDYATIDALRAAGITHVRLDLTESDPKGSNERFLGRLIEGGFSVLLHVFQSPEIARQMPDSAAQQAWSALLDKLLSRYGSRIFALEVGSTVNRKRWAGYSLRGFLVMWQLAWAAAQKHGVRLLGPSVTDFEPPWNVGLLALLARRGCLPDIHSNNLFSERCTEPERFDHKILGRHLTLLHRFNLIKKARLLQRLGADAGVPRLFSPAAFWTLPRIERVLPDSEQKQADYLSRYLVLCAASGALEGAWWGPLICHREGLIDDGVKPYPALERITHYANVGGDVHCYRRRPAFDALRTVNQLLVGARYAGPLSTSDGLEIHVFEQAGRCLHALWTTNGRVAVLAHLYTADSLASATLLSRDGETEAYLPHRLVSESPCFLSWAAADDVRLQPGVCLFEGVALHRHRTDGADWFFEDQDWRGVIRARSFNEAEKRWHNLLSAVPSGPMDGGLMRKARNAIWSLSAGICGNDIPWVVKKPIKMHLHKRWLDRFKPSKAVRSWSGSCELLRRGIAAAPPVAFIEARGENRLFENYYVCEHVNADFSIRDVFDALAQGAPEYAGVAADTVYAWVADYLLRLHARGIHFRDLSGGNLLVEAVDRKTWQFTLIDTGRLHACNDALSLGKRLDDLVRVCNKLHWAGREVLLRRYFAAMGRPWGAWQRLPFYLYDWKVYLKRRFGRKAVKRWLGR